MSQKKYVIIHADDAGLCWSENKATQVGMTQGSISSTSLMVPCPWFYDMAQFCLAHPELDYGIHLTLTGEWKTYPFKSITAKEKIPSIVDHHGHLPMKRAAIRDHAKIEEVRLELRNQIDYALSLGLQPSHLDSHMYTLGLRQDLIDLYIDLGKEYQLPIILSKTLIDYTGEDSAAFKVNENDCIETLFMASYTEFEGMGLATYYEMALQEVQPGLSLFLIHPALLNEEIEQITLDHPNFGAVWRSQDAAFFSSQKCKELVAQNNIELVHFKSPEVLSLLGA
jgi:predicted glycoside hydrolase/deacetylase ChbG (UPF0249 family)